MKILLNQLKLNQGFRAIRIWRTLAFLITFIWWDSRQWSYLRGYNKKNIEFRRQLRAKWLTKQLLELGSAFIKLGQLLSARPDVLPAGWVIELADLQDNVTPFSFEKVEDILKKELGSNHFNEIIYLEKSPIGAASLAQVHQAKLKNGRQVVFKVQRPNIQNLFRLDLEVMQQVARFVQKNPNWSKGRDWIGIAKESKRVLLRELDFKIEAQYAARFKQQFLDNPEIRIPGVIWELSTTTVLCLDFIPGTKINDIKELKAKGIDTSEIAKIGTASYLQQLVLFGFFHADPHPGNLAVANDGALIYYDFGMMGLISSSLRERIGSMVRAAARKDAKNLVKGLQEAGLIAPNVDLGPVRRLIRIMLDDALTPPFDSNVLSKLSGDLYDLVYGQPFRLPVEFIFVLRALSTFEGVGRNLDPNFNLMAIAKPYLLPLMTSSNSSPNDLINELGKQVGALGSKAVALPKRIDQSLEKLEQGDLQLQVRIGESDRQMRNMVYVQQVLSQSILLGSLGISAAVIGSSNQPKLALLPIFLSLPILLKWFKLQIKLSKANRLEKVQGYK